jgi:ketosteroid isomerase-like protein
MSTERNTQVGIDFFNLLGRGAIDAALALATDDMTYWIAGKPGSVPSCGTRGKKEMRRLFEGMLQAIDGGMAFTVKGSTAEGDRVALEIEGQSRRKNGRAYDNEYHVLLRFRDGKICAVREYLDTHYVYDVWYRPEEGGTPAAKAASA